jgi:putative DNA primase/helicase
MPTDPDEILRLERADRLAAGGNVATAAAGEPTPPPGPYTYKAATVTPRAVEWLWPGRIPLGKLTTFAGLGGLGKTFTLCDIAARVSIGALWPDLQQGPMATKGQVLFISGEDDPDDTLVPRMLELGANLDKIHFMRTERQDRFLLSDVPTLEKCLEEMGDGVRLVAIDPPTAFLGGVDDHKNAELRGILSPLKSWATARKLALIFNTHFTKGTGATKVEAMARVMGSVAWVNAVRAAHAFCRDPDDPDKYIFASMKMNLCKRPASLAYAIKITHAGLAKIDWLGEVNVSADDAASGVARPRRTAAVAWLTERFQEKAEWRTKVLIAAAAQEGISRSALFEAKEVLRVPRSKKVTETNGDEHFIWCAPENFRLGGFRETGEILPQGHGQQQFVQFQSN